MTEQELIIGEKYVPIGKSIGSSLDQSIEWERAASKGQRFLYYRGLMGKFHLFSNRKGKIPEGDDFLPSDVIPYKEDVVIPDPLAKYKLLVQKYEELELMYAVKITPIDTKDLTWKGWKRVSELRAEINKLKKELE